MDFFNYILSAPKELELLGRETEIQLLKLYAFNAYYNADPICTQDVNDGFTYRRDKYAGIDGVYINETLEENTIECIRGYYLGNDIFRLNDIYNLLDKISAEINEVAAKKFLGNTEADNLLDEYLSESENKKVVIRIITDYECDAKEKYEINKKIENYNLTSKTLQISAVMAFADDIKAVIESNKAPFDWVELGALDLDKPNNILTHEDNSIICNISAKSLKKLWEAEGRRGLLAMNLRYYIKSANIDNKIEDSIIFDNKNFWYLNNGIIVVCNDYRIENNRIVLSQFSIVNGGQTTTMIGTTPFENDFYVACKVIRNTFELPSEKNMFISKVAEASNTQKPIKAKDIIANRIEQRNLKSLLSENKVFIEIKRGDKCFHEQYPEPWQRTKNNELAQDLYSFVYMEPGPARNSVSTMLSNEDKYNKIFREHKYSFDFLRDILFIEKAYKEYQKKVSKMTENSTEDAYKKGLVKNGLTYCLATLGYLLKLNYNKEFKANMHKYRNHESKYNLFSSELAFMHGFIDRDLTYDEFKNNAFDLFDSLFTSLIIPTFKIAKESSPSIAYSNWTKSNTGFNSIRSTINVWIFDNKQEHLIDLAAKHFINIDEKQENENIDRYVDYCKANKKIKHLDNDGFQLSENDAALRDELMIFRLKYSQEKHIAENKLFTDKMLDKLVVEKPVDMISLKKIISAASSYYCGTELISIIGKYL